MADAGRGRELVAQGVIAVSVVVGAWILLVQPKARELNAMKAEIAELEAPSQAQQSLPLALLGQRARELSERGRQIERFSAIAADTAHW